MSQSSDKQPTGEQAWSVPPVVSGAEGAPDGDTVPLHRPAANQPSAGSGAEIQLVFKTAGQGPDVTISIHLSADAGAPIPNPIGTVELLVTLDQAAAIVQRSKRTLERYKHEMPPPRVRGRRGQPDEWSWAELRPWLAENFNRLLPETFPSHLRRRGR